MRFATLSVLVVSLCLTSACASFDRVAVTRFEPTKTEGSYTYYRFTAFADAAYPLDSEEAEATRSEWLRQWLTDNGYANAKYEVLSRKPVLRNKALLADVYDIYYDVSVLLK